MAFAEKALVWFFSTITGTDWTGKEALRTFRKHTVALLLTFAALRLHLPFFVAALVSMATQMAYDAWIEPKD